MSNPSDVPPGLKAYTGALTMVGPTVEDDLQRAIARYGVDEVKKALKALTRQRAGRKKITDHEELRPIFERDARIWLEGGNPFAEQSDYAIARDKALLLTGHRRAAAIDRVERKLGAECFGREWFTFVAALQISYSEFSYTHYLESLAALAEIDPDWIWSVRLQDAAQLVTRYEASIGARLPDSHTMKQVDDETRFLKGGLSAVAQRPLP